MGNYRTFEDIKNSLPGEPDPTSAFQVIDEQVWFMHSDDQKPYLVTEEGVGYDYDDAVQIANQLNLAYALGEHAGANNPYA